MLESLICISHLRWNFVYQRPQHLMSRFRKYFPVYYVEEPVYDTTTRYNEIIEDPGTGVVVVTPHLPEEARNKPEELRVLIDLLISSTGIKKMILWYYSPLGLQFTDHLSPELIVYDCMDELSAFRFAPPELKEYEQRLMEKAGLVFTGGQRLYEAKKHRHRNIHAFPSSIDKEHFESARKIAEEPADQRSIPHPRIGFYGVIDERFDVPLLKSVAEKNPQWHFVVLGPTAKIDPASLPERPNIHFLGQKNYKQLPGYLAGWDIAMMPFAINEATAFISPTKTPEYLAGGKPVVSTPVHDVVRPYGEMGFVEIAATAEEFEKAIGKLLETEDRKPWLAEVDAFLAGNSWNMTWMKMSRLMREEMGKKNELPEKKEKAYV